MQFLSHTSHFFRINFFFLCPLYYCRIIGRFL
nr:MAG TPA: hypothetical protein [Caudoviricetes sp.]